MNQFAYPIYNGIGWKREERPMNYELPEQFAQFGDARKNGFLRVKKIKENGGLIVKPEIGAWENPHTFYVCEECGKMITDIGK